MGSKFEVDNTGKLTAKTLKVVTAPMDGYVLTSDESGNASWQQPTIVGIQGHVILATGVTMTQRPKLLFDGTGVTVTDDPINEATKVMVDAGAPGPNGHIIQYLGADLPVQPNLNFTGAGVTAVNDDMTYTTVVTISGGAGSGDKHVIYNQNETSPLYPREGLNFTGAGVSVADDEANGQTIVTIPGALGTGGHIVNGLTWRPSITFDGNGVTVTDDPVNFATKVTIATAGLGEASHHLLSDLDMDDHPQYVRNDLLTTLGDIFYAKDSGFGGVIRDRFPRGTAGQVLSSDDVDGLKWIVAPYAGDPGVGYDHGSSLGLLDDDHPQYRLKAKDPLYAYDTGGTLTSADFGKAITVNSGTAQVLTLPSVTDTDLGANFTFFKVGTGSLQIVAPGAYISDSSLGGSITEATSAVNRSIHLELVKNTSTGFRIWVITAGIGTWTTA